MISVSTYSVKITNYANIFNDTLQAYRHAVDFFISVALDEWATLGKLSTIEKRLTAVESATHATAKHPAPRYNFDTAEISFLKFPSYLRRAAINAALGAVSSYKTNFANWEKSKQGNPPSPPGITCSFPAFYKDNMYVRTSDYTAKVKVWHKKDWVWLDVAFRKSDVDYIKHHLASAKECSPTLRKRGKCWSLDFAFERKIKLNNNDPLQIIAADLGINSACTCVSMGMDGTVADRAVLKLSTEEDRLRRAIGHIKRAQRHGARRMQRLWAVARGVNQHIAEQTATFIIEQAIRCKADVIVLEHLNFAGRKRGGSRRQRLHLWKAKDILRIVTHRAHLLNIRVSTVNPRGTSQLAFDGSGRVLRGKDLPNAIKSRHGACYSLCLFDNNKLYNADLNAAYNIGARYWIRKIQKSIPAMVWQEVSAKIPGLLRGITRTLSDLFSLNAALAA